MFTEEVRKGFEWLKEIRGSEIERIDLESLDLKDPDLCVLGQTGGLNEALGEDIRVRCMRPWHQTEWLYDHGFDLHEPDDELYAALTETWKAWISMYRAGLVS